MGNVKKMPRGAIPTPRHILEAATPYKPTGAPLPAVFSWSYGQVSSWGNLVWGDCTVAEEAFAKSCKTPFSVFVSDQEVISWAAGHNALAGANIYNVAESMQKSGFLVNGAEYKNGGQIKTVDCTKAECLQSAIHQGPVKIGIDVSNIEKDIKDKDGKVKPKWFVFGADHTTATNHCVSLFGYGKLSDLVTKLGFPSPPSEIDSSTPCYAMFTWKSVGIIDATSLENITHEALVRIPTTIGAMTRFPVHSGFCCYSGSGTGLPQSVFYQSFAGDIEQLCYSGGWRSNGLIEGASYYKEEDKSNAKLAPIPVANTSLCCFQGGGSGIPQAVFYQSVDCHLVQLHQDSAGSAWTSNDLTLSANALMPVANTSLCCFQGGGDGIPQSVFYQTADFHVVHLFQDPVNSAWIFNDLMQLSEAPKTAANTSLCCFQGNGGEICKSVFYQSTDGHVVQLYQYTNPEGHSVWTSNDLTQSANAPAPIPNTPLCCFQGDGGKKIPQSVFYQSDDGHIVQLYYDSGWKFADLTTESNTKADKPAPALGTSLCCFQGDGDGIPQSVFYQSADGHVVQLCQGSAGSAWTFNDLTQKTSFLPEPAKNTPICCFQGGGGVPQSVFYQSADGHVAQLCYGAGWNGYTLAAIL